LARRRQVSTRLLEEEVKRLVSLLEEEGAEFQELGRYEVLRARLGEDLVVVYRTGKAVYHEGLIPLVERSLLRPEGIEVGSDEVGKGEDEGPIVVAAVALDPESAAWLRARGLTETKSIPRGEIQAVAARIEERCLDRAVRLVTPEEFSRVWVRGTLNRLLAEWHLEVLREVLERLERVDVVAVDAFDSGALESRLRRLVPPGATLVVEPKADERFPSVAAASVLARARRDEALRSGLTGRKWRS